MQTVFTINKFNSLKQAKILLRINHLYEHIRSSTSYKLQLDFRKNKYQRQILLNALWIRPVYISKWLSFSLLSPVIKPDWPNIRGTQDCCFCSVQAGTFTKLAKIVQIDRNSWKCVQWHILIWNWLYVSILQYRVIFFAIFIITIFKQEGLYLNGWQWVNLEVTILSVYPVM